MLGYVLAAGCAVGLIAGRKAGLTARAFQTRTLPMAPFFTAGVVLTLWLPG
jgi:prepilin signal peptidase PulO-like enzyme (type II secretory pathway)